MKTKYAILDTDFISKLHTTTNSKEYPFIEHLLRLPYLFCCHEQISKEISFHNKNAAEWLKQNIFNKRITCYSDMMILVLIQSSFKCFSVFQTIFLYLSYLQKSCEIYSRNFYSTYYEELESLPDSITFDDFCIELKKCDEKVGRGNNLGEIKDTLLILSLGYCTGENIFLLCSDDKTARRSIIANYETESLKISCISVFGFFYVSKIKNLLSKEESEEYLSSWLSYNTNNISIITHSERKQPDYSKIDAKEVFGCIWKNSMFMGSDGFLRYR